MEKLSKKQYWDTRYQGRQAVRERKRRMADAGKRWAVRLLGPDFAEYAQSYPEYLRWDVIYERYMPRWEGAKLLEVGSAPGDFLVKLHRRFGFVPYGVEYAQSGVEINRKVFSEHGLDPNHVIFQDFFSDEFHDRYRESFDIVLSRGFIEHFSHVEQVVDKHLNLLKKGGYLIVSIPNYRGFNYLLKWLFNRDALAVHNLSIMEKDKFTKLFDEKRVTPLFCNYFGTFSFGLFHPRKNSPWHALLSLCKHLQIPLNVLFRLLFRDQGAESRYFSPYLMFIGVKET